MSLFRTLSRFRTLFYCFYWLWTNLHQGEACQTFHIATMWKHEMIVHAQSGMKFHRQKKNVGEILQLAQFRMILVWFHFLLILVLYFPQYVINNIHNMKVFTIFWKFDYTMTLNNHIQQTKITDHKSTVFIDKLD